MVLSFYAAVNEGDFDRAWALGGKNLGKNKASFTKGYADTVSSQVVVVGTRGATVDVLVVAEEAQGRKAIRTSRFRGSYVVRGGEIVSGTLRRVAK